MPYDRSHRPSLYSVELRTGRWEEMVNWYRMALGLRVLVRVVEDGYALIEAGETRLAIISRPMNGEPSPRWSLGFEVHDLDRVSERLVTAGSKIAQPRRHDEGFQELVTADPDGNSIRLFEWPNRD
jgi:predicted enzyme related to lactoylglutathione lyase